MQAGRAGASQALRLLRFFSADTTIVLLHEGSVEEKLRRRYTRGFTQAHYKAYYRWKEVLWKSVCRVGAVSRVP